MLKINKLFAIVFIFLSFIVFAFLESRDEKTYKVLDIMEGDKFCIDLNSNGITDENEIIHIKDINTFPIKYSSKVKEYEKRFNLTPDEMLSLGYAAKEYSKEMLLGKYVTLPYGISPYNKNYGYRFAAVYLEGGDYAKYLLNNGLAFAYINKEFNKYSTLESKDKIFVNAKDFKKLDVKIADDVNKIYHNPFCVKSVKIKSYKLLPYKSVPRDYKQCPYCAVKSKKLLDATLSYYKKSRSFTSGDIALFLISPLEYKRPSVLCRTNACKFLLKQINESRVSIDAALYGIDKQNEIADALKRAKDRGVQIRLVSDSYPGGVSYYKDTSGLFKNFKTVYDNKNSLMHNKFFIFDNKKVLTGTMNISATGSGGYNANTMILINNPSVAFAYKNEFEQMYGGKFQKIKTNKDTNVTLSDGTKVFIYFSPKGNAYEEGISPVIKNARKKVYVSIFYLTHKGIINDLINAADRNVDVKVIVDAVGASNYKNRINYLRKNNVKVKVENWGGKNHEKNIMADDEILITGSANFSVSAMTKNDENVLVIHNKKLAKFYGDYFINLYNSIDNKYLKYFPRAESFESVNSCYDGIDNNFDGKKDSEDAGCGRHRH